MNTRSFITQDVLEKTLQSLFPNHHMVKNARKVAHIQTDNQYFLELDVWFPEIKLAFEFQDPHHYVSVWYADASPAAFQTRDDKKKRVMSERGESLIVVPCWWDGSADSLVASIKEERPDLLSEYIYDNPIPKSPPKEFFQGVDLAGSLMIPSHPMTLQFDPQNWWMSEKYDGIRACWQIEKGELYSRHGSPITVHDSFYESLPLSSNLDGELWFGRNGFKETQNIINGNSSWDFLRFIIFDIPVSSVPYESRYKNIVTLSPSFPHTLTISPQMKCLSREHLGKYFSSATNFEGEGLVIRKYLSLYIGGRSPDVVKIKSSRDQEALVVKINSDSETCLLQLDDGTTFTAKIRSASNLLKEMKAGDIVSFTYDSFSKNVPVNAVVFRIRFDLPMLRIPTSASKKGIKESDENQSHPRGYWTIEGSSNVRKFFDDYALEKQKDPSDPVSWYDISWKEITQRKGNGLLSHYDSILSALADAYPESNFEVHKFARVPRNYWNEKANRRKFFDSIATEAGFDPLSPSNWYSYLSTGLILTHKGIWTILEHHQYSHETALMDLYPEIGFVKSSFPFVKRVLPPPTPLSK